MKVHFLSVTKICVLTVLSLSCHNAYGQWKPQPSRISTTWTDSVSPDKCLEEYPRPIMQRNEWTNLNGIWSYALRKHNTINMGKEDGKILVPFPIESSLSGVMKQVGADLDLWYRRFFTISEKWEGKHILLHFGAVDWSTDVYVNDKKVGSHQGGYTDFTFDITPYLTGKSKQKLELRVWDPTTDGYQPVGKQNSNPQGIWYTPVTGIWQTAWMEPVNEQYITGIRTWSDIDRGTISVSVESKKVDGKIRVALYDGKRLLKIDDLSDKKTASFFVSSPHLWSPDDPFLYNLKISIIKNGKIMDEINSYTAMRKISTAKDKKGVMRIQLNNRCVFQFGPLDQGYWPDGLYTAPTDDALKADIELVKKLGYNMIRKHMKVEPARWYTWCDRLGILVWQDMPCGDKSPEWQSNKYFDGKEIYHSVSSEQNFRKEWKDIMDELQPYPSVVVWTPFNEAWGQFKTEEISLWTKKYDPTRLVNPASGGNHYQCGDMLDLHHYPEPSVTLYDDKRPTVLGEYGGLGLPIEGHLWQSDRNWGYIEFKNSKDITNRYIDYANQLAELARSRFSAAVYTQTTDVEGEVNGLVTYDRKILKFEKQRIKKANEMVCHALDNNK
jgi:beta-galactosidase/beta-glucuronidase